MAKQIQLTATMLEAHMGQRLDQALAKLFLKYSRSRIKEWILERRVNINGTIIDKPAVRILGGEHVSITADVSEVEQCWKAQNIQLDIFYEDNDLIVINKPSKLVVHPSPGNPDGTLLNALLYHYPQLTDVPRAGIVHRLDKDTTGLMVVAKTLLAQTYLVKALQSHEIIREYEAVVIGTMIAGGTVNEPMARHATKRTHMAVQPMGKAATTYYRIMEHFRAHTHLRLRLETGRTHQIRVHMAHINHPLVGDPLYSGRPRPPPSISDALIEILRGFDRQALHATMLRLYHPITGIEMNWHVPLPQDMIKLIDSLKVDTNEFLERMKWL